MIFKMLTSSDSMWNKAIEYARKCSWKAGVSLANEMNKNAFSDWERVIVAIEEEKICGFCTAAKKDCIPNVCYTPYIGYIFVDEKYRGERLSSKLIDYSADYLKSIGFDKAYIVSDHDGLYEKYGFKVIDRKIAPWGAEEKIYLRKI